MDCEYTLDSLKEGLARLAVEDTDNDAQQQEQNQHDLSHVQSFKTINFRDPAGNYNRVKLSGEQSLESFLSSNRGRYLVDEEHYFTPRFVDIHDGATYTLGGWEGLLFSCQDDDGKRFKAKLSSERGFKRMLLAVGCDCLITSNGERAYTFADLDVHETYMFGRD
jgi:hypothetical protein